MSAPPAALSFVADAHRALEEAVPTGDMTTGGGDAGSCARNRRKASDPTDGREREMTLASMRSGCKSMPHADRSTSASVWSAGRNTRSIERAAPRGARSDSSTQCMLALSWAAAALGANTGLESLIGTRVRPAAFSWRLAPSALVTRPRCW